MKVISTEKAPAAIGPYSQAIEIGGMLFASGQIPVDPATGEVPAEAGLGYENVVKTTCFLADMADFAAFNEVYAKYFTGKPARSCVAVKGIPKGVLCEIEVIAAK